MSDVRPAPGVWAGIDLGGTKIQAVVTGRAARVLGGGRRNTPTRGGPEAVVAELAGTVGDALAQGGIDPARLRGVGVGAPGSIDPAAGVVFEAVNIEGWDAPFPLGPALAAELGVPVAIANDVSVAVEAERRYGVGREYRSFLGVFWGTGVGGGLVVDGRLLHGRGSAGEIGHVCAKPGGRRCNCGLRGCVEAYAGRGALEERARREARRRKTVLFDLMRKRGRDRLTSGVWLRALDVEAVVIGGGLGERLGPRWLKRIEKAARAHTFFREPPVYRLAELGDMGGAIGASLLARSS